MVANVQLSSKIYVANFKLRTLAELSDLGERLSRLERGHAIDK